MRLDVNKYVFVGLSSDLHAFFERAQEMGIVHFIGKGISTAKEVPEEIQKQLNALKVLRRQPVLPQEELEHISNADQLVHQINTLEHQLERLEEQERVLRLEIARAEILGQFSFTDLEEIERISGRKVQFLFAKKEKITEENVPEDVLYLKTAHGFDYFMSIAKEPILIEDMIEMKFDKELNTLIHDHTETKQNIKKRENELKALHKYHDFIQRALAIKIDQNNLLKAENAAESTFENRLFTINGWVPQSKLEELELLLKDVNVTSHLIAQDAEEVAPTYLENTGVSRIGEDLVHIYDTPSNEDADPSLWVLVSFSLFFAMIIGDGGYGLLFLLGALYFAYKKPNLSLGAKRGLQLATILFSSCIVWGVLTHSFFGIELAQDNPIRKLSLTDYLAENKAVYLIKNQSTLSPEELSVDHLTDSVLMEIALLVGVSHTILSLLRYLRRNPSALGWVAVIIGCYLYFPTLLNATSLLHYQFGINPVSSAENGLYLIYGGLTFALVTACIKSRWLGLLEISNFIQIFADILSYLRLYALAMAGAIISLTVNEIAYDLQFVFGGLLLIFGHGLNMVLSLIGGVIHGLRLNFIEWYHYSFEGGGRIFNPLRKTL